MPRSGALHSAAKDNSSNGLLTNGIITTLVAYLTVTSLLSVRASAAVVPAAFDNVTWDTENWILRTTKPSPGHYQSRASIANGYIGISLASLGPFFEVDNPVAVNGWPLFDRRQTFATVAGFYDQQPTTNGTNFEWLNQLGGESVISGIPHWGGIVLQSSSGHILDATTPLSQIDGFSSTLDIKSALQSWKFTWSPPGGHSFRVEYKLLAHKLYVNQAAVQLKVTSDSAAILKVVDVLEGDSAVRTNTFDTGTDGPRTIWSAVQPRGIPDARAYVYSTLHSSQGPTIRGRKISTSKSFVGRNDSSIAQEYSVNLQSNRAAVIEKYVGIASSDAFEEPKAVALHASHSGCSHGFDDMLKSHQKEWESIMTPDTVDDFTLPSTGELPDDSNILDLQISAVTNPFALLQNTVGSNAVAAADNNEKLLVNSIPVAGLAGSSYAGFVFWDVEVWMSPSLVVAYPEATRQVANYRLEKYEQARRNTAKRETASTSRADAEFSPDTAVYPWTSGRFGNCTGTGPCYDYEYHVNGDIALELENYYIVSGDEASFENKYYPIYDSIAHLFSDLIYYNKTLKGYGLRNATDPDEFASGVDNPAFTMVLMKTILERANKLRARFGRPQNSTWSNQAENMYLPISRDANLILEYSGMNGTIQVKQADVALIDDNGFVAYPNDYTVPDLLFYAGRQILQGPGMTFGVFSVVSATHLDSGCSSYTYDLYGSQPYARAPWYQYSEQLIDDPEENEGTNPAFPFLTGMGGASRVAIFGYLGLHLQLDSFHISPVLPPQIPHLSFRTIYWQGHAIKASANQTHTTLRRLPEKDLPTANADYNDGNGGVPVTVTHIPGKIHHLTTTAGHLVIPNRQPHLKKSIPGNLAQCVRAVSESEIYPGQYAIGAVDGSISTTWQPRSPDKPATLAVELGPAGFVPIGSFELDWAQDVPRRYNVAFTNASDPASASADELREAWRDGNVEVSRPYNPVRANLVRPYDSNTTNVTLDEAIWGGHWALLTIEGNKAARKGEKAEFGASVAEWGILPA
ncbi:MAG: hypothetical protein M1831_007314 [Alyxoria varia]|nr:MAG: hypothetical protein M1831_007314 [Alyxoria varia]